MIEVGILYSDLTKVWKPISEVANFRKDGVLTITITRERGNRRALVAREWSLQNNDRQAASAKAWWGEDNYAIGVMPDGRVFTTQWPDNDEKLRTFSSDDGSETAPIEAKRVFPPQATVHVFIGAYLPPPQWEIALGVFERDMF